MKFTSQILFTMKPVSVLYLLLCAVYVQKSTCSVTFKFNHFSVKHCVIQTAISQCVIKNDSFQGKMC